MEEPSKLDRSLIEYITKRNLFGKNISDYHESLDFVFNRQITDFNMADISELKRRFLMKHQELVDKARKIETLSSGSVNNESYKISSLPAGQKGIALMIGSQEKIFEYQETCEFYLNQKGIEIPPDFGSYFHKKL